MDSALGLQGNEEPALYDVTACGLELTDGSANEA